jgi:hypothetical protein
MSARRPELDAVAEQLAGRAKIVKLDVDEEPEIAGRYGIQSIPALFIFKNGKVVDQILGAQPRQVIAASWRRKSPHSVLQISGWRKSGGETLVSPPLFASKAPRSSVLGPHLGCFAAAARCFLRAVVVAQFSQQVGRVGVQVFGHSP